MSRYPEREIGEVLELETDHVEVAATESYELAGVYSFGRGLFARDPLSGSDTSYSKLNRLHEGTLVMSRLKAFEGAVAVVPASFDGYHLSQEFPTFRIKEDAARTYLHYLTQWPELWRRLGDTSKGLGSRRERVHPDAFLKLRVPLPDSAEQRRVGAELDLLLSTARSIHRQVEHREDLINALDAATLWSVFHELSERYGETPISEAADINPESVHPQRDIADDTFTYIDISAVENGSGRIIEPKDVPTAAAPDRARRRIRTGDTLLSTVRPNLRAFALVPPELDEAICSTGFAVLRPKGKTLPEFLWRQTHSGQFLQQLIDRSRGHYPAISVRRLEKTHLTVPDPPEQHRALSLLDRHATTMVDLREASEHGASTAQALPESLLNSAFSGDL